MSHIELWKLCDDYSVMHAALIATGNEPADIEGWSDHDIERQNPGYIAVRTALCGAIESGKLVPSRLVRFESDFEAEGGVDVRRTIIAVSDLDTFFKAKGRHYEMFSRSASVAGQNQENPYFSKKLHAANLAWAAVTSDPARLRGRSPKQALQQWLTEHAEELGLLNKDKKPNRNGIEEICKVANWRPEGGATPTPGPELSPVPAPLIPMPTPQSDPSPSNGFKRERWSPDLDDEIPF